MSEHPIKPQCLQTITARNQTAKKQPDLHPFSSTVNGKKPKKSTTLNPGNKQPVIWQEQLKTNNSQTVLKITSKWKFQQPFQTKCHNVCLKEACRNAPTR